MNKNVKRIIAMAVAIGTVSAVAPAASINLLTTKAFAATTNTYENLDSLKLTSSSGSNIKLYSDNSYDSSDKVDDDEVSADDTYYAKTSSDTINVEIDGPSTKYVRVFKGTSSSTKGKKISSDISISDTTTIVIKVYGEDPGTDVRYDEDDDYDLLSTYKIKVKYTGSDNSSSSDSSADDYDEIYLDKITIDGDAIDLSESEVNYSYNVASDVDEVTIKAVPEDEDTDTVEIDGNDVDSSDKYKQTVSLDKGQNKIEIKVTNEDDEERVYTLKINRGTSTSSTTSSTTSATNTAVSSPSTATEITTTKVSQWVQTNGVWKYNDATGNVIKNSWIQNYYVQADGSMATGWLSYNGGWYYLGTDGARKTGWQSVNKVWYYLDSSEGKMKTGWMKDTNGKYYYLNSDGSMAFNTTITGYKLGSDGAWMK